MAVGTYTGTGSQGIYTYHFDLQTGKATLLHTLAMDNPSYVCFSASGKTLYAVNENEDSTATVSAVRVNPRTGAMRLLNHRLTEGAAPCYVERWGRTVLTANYFGGTMSVFGVADKGALGMLVKQVHGTTGGPDADRQCTPHVHTARFTPDVRYILATDFSADRLLRITLPLPTNGQPKVKAYAVSPGSGPRHIEFSPDGRMVYVMSELSDAVTVFRYHDGELEKVQEVKAGDGAHGGADIHITPDARFLYASVRLKDDGIAIFRVLDDGTLEKIGYQLTGIHPRNFCITPDGCYLLCACRDSNKIQVFSIDDNTGMLTDLHQDILLPKPVCIKFAK